MAEKMGIREMEFMRRVRDGLPLAPADRYEDRCRQRLRKSGLVEVLMKQRRWSLTEAGRLSLDEATHDR
jgi:hypothetical protein